MTRAPDPVTSSGSERRSSWRSSSPNRWRSRYQVRVLSSGTRNRLARERRTVPFSSLAGGDQDADEPAVDPDRFLPSGHRWAGHWAAPPRSCQLLELTEGNQRVLLHRARSRVRAALEQYLDATPRRRRH